MTYSKNIDDIRCWWCDSTDVIVVSDNLYKCESCERFKPFVGGSYDFINSGWNLVGGAELDTFFGVKLSTYLQQSISSMVENPTRFLIDVRKYF